MPTRTHVGALMLDLHKVGYEKIADQVNSVKQYSSVYTYTILMGLEMDHVRA